LRNECATDHSGCQAGRNCKDRTVEIGVHARLTDESIDVRELARRAEGLGFESLFLPEHTHIPASFVESNPDRAEWADWAARLFDPFTSLAAAAAVTDTIKLGTGVCLVPEHHAITLAKQVATLDRLSRGRLILGVGAGWVEGELAHHGVSLGKRFLRLRESLLAMQAIWEQDEASFSGDGIRFEGVRQGPKPSQQPHPPILVGGEGERAVAIAREVSGEWFPHAGADLGLAEGLRVSIFGAEQDGAAIAGYADAGVTRCVLILPSTRPGEAEEELSRLAELTARVRAS
jgi:probable F420-dependent oxidoreductase